MKRLLATIILALGSGIPATAADRPSILLVLTDDQGFGDLGCHGNPVIKTPALDAFARQSAWLKNFYVSPVCSPTRSSLLTGQYNYRVGIVDTFLGRSMMRPEAKTLAEFLATAGYRTGLFGKWHLGDNHPFRPEDHGFQETLWLQGGGLAQPADPPGLDPKTAYFDPILRKNGKEVRTKGYCTDVITDAALSFLATPSEKPFFAYIAYNAPHDPFQVPEALAAPYKKLGLTPSGFPKVGQPWATPKLNTDAIAHAYAMIENIDTNFARLMKAIDDRKLADNTVVIFLTDNGPGGVRFNAGLRNRKGTVYEGGIRVPCYARWPKQTRAGSVIDTPLAHIDWAPTLLEACGVRLPAERSHWDGRSFLSLLSGRSTDWPDRTLFFQWHRGDAPERYRAFAARGPRYKLVQSAGVPPAAKWQPKFELFDVPNDPFEMKDLAAEKSDEVARLKKEYDAWFDDVTRQGFDPPRIVIGSEKENPVRLSRQDWRGPRAGWAPNSQGHWVVRIERTGKYRVTIRSTTEFVTCGFGSSRPNDTHDAESKVSVKEYTFPMLTLAEGDIKLEAWVGQADSRRGAHSIELEYRGK